MVNACLRQACETLRCSTDSNVCNDMVIALLFLKYISDNWLECVETYRTQYGSDPELVVELLKNERFVVPKEANFYYLYEHRYMPGNGERLDRAFHLIEEANNNKLKCGGVRVFADVAFNLAELGSEKQKNALLRQLLEDFAKPELNWRRSRISSLDVIAKATDYLFSVFAASDEQFADDGHAPAAVAELIAELMQLKSGQSLCDPLCGAGTLLIKCAHKIQRDFHSRHYTLYGQEAQRTMWAMAKLNLYLHGEDNHKIEWGDALCNPLLLDKESGLLRFDRVFSVLPFSRQNWDQEQARADKFGRFTRGAPPKTKVDYAFILHMLATLKPDGRMAVVMPHGALFRGATEAQIRQQLVDENLLDAVIGLPEKLFPGTAIATVLLIFDKNKSSDKVLFIDAGTQFSGSRNQPVLHQVDIDRILNVYRQRQSVRHYAFLASREDIQRNDYRLNIRHFVDTSDALPMLNTKPMQATRRKLHSELRELDKKMESYLKVLGHD